MAQARTRSGPLARLRERLVIAASARHLAIDLVERHGGGAAEAGRVLASADGLSAQQRLVLVRAEPLIAQLLGRAGRPSSHPARAPARRAMATAD